MSDTGLTVPGMNEPPRCYDVTVTVDRDGGHLLNPGRVRRIGPRKRHHPEVASIISAHTAGADHQRGHRPGRGPVTVTVPVATARVWIRTGRREAG